MMAADKVSLTHKITIEPHLKLFFHQGDDGKGGDVGSGSSDDKVGKSVNQDCINRFNLLI